MCLSIEQKYVSQILQSSRPNPLSYVKLQKGKIYCSSLCPEQTQQPTQQKSPDPPTNSLHQVLPPVRGLQCVAWHGGTGRGGDVSCARTALTPWSGGSGKERVSILEVETNCAIVQILRSKICFETFVKKVTLTNYAVMGDLFKLLYIHNHIFIF